ncbi:MAG: DNA translocase FtsK 4TM domain-containing protein [Phycisphaeraceae bacterium]|nr:DNA translocase FtsK 4TM domain-containing protein [Phycisphaeraceae bacterium]
MAESALSRSAGRALGASSARASKSASSSHDPSLLWRRVFWMALAACWLFLAVSAVTFNLADPPSPIVTPANDPVANWCGRVGAAAAYYSYEMLGLGVWVLMLLWGLHLSIMAAGKRVGHLGVRFLGAFLMAGSFAAIQALLLPNSGPVRGLGGGLIGTVGTHELTTRFNALGAFMILSLVFMVGAVVALDAWALVAALWAGKAVISAGRPVARLAASVGGVARAKVESVVAARLATAGTDPEVRLNDLDDDEEIPGREEKPRRARTAEPDDDDEPMLEFGDESITVDEDEEAALETAEARAHQKAAAKARRARPVAEAVDPYPPVEDDTEPAAADDAEPAQPRTYDPEALRAKIARLPLRFASATTRAATEEDMRDIQNASELEGYQFPGLDILEDPEVNYSERMEAFVREQAEILGRALAEYRIDGEVVGIESGPVITNYEIRLAPGTKGAVLQSVASDLARALKAINIRIVPNTAGRDTVGIEVPNAIKEKVRLKELMTRSEAASKMALPMFLGKDAAGEPLVADLASMPHLLIAGTTGSGKSVCMNTVIMSFLYTRKPNELKLVLVDPKMVELNQFKDIPHLMCPVVTDMAKAAAILEWAVGKMDERYELLAEAACRDITSYNSLPWEELKERFNPATPDEEARIPRKLPYMVFVIDELADLIITNKEVEQFIVRIAQKARAVGIHLIVATQRPQANVVTGLIKSNMPARISFKVASGMDSRIVLDQKGGELLLGQGDMLYLSPRSSKLTRAQGTLVDDAEIRKAVKFMRTIATPTYERQLIQLRSAGAAAEAARDGFMNAQEDDLFDKAVEIVLETRLGSVSMLQRRLAIGYTRAARLVEMMGEAGILGAHKGTVAREVMMSLDEWHALKAQAEADAQAGGPPDASASEPSPQRLSLADAVSGARSDSEDPFEDAFQDEDGDERHTTVPRRDDDDSII